jgi:hypothetical protein
LIDLSVLASSFYSISAKTMVIANPYRNPITRRLEEKHLAVAQLDAKILAAKFATDGDRLVGLCLQVIRDPRGRGKILQEMVT